jgi:hypothetical protein
MKKFVFATFLLVVFAVGMSSCASHERCAAYGKANKKDTEKQIPANKSIQQI